MITFRMLGAPELRRSSGSRPGMQIAGAKRLALLSYLAIASRRGPQRRDVLLGHLWPDLDEKHARNSLSNIIYQIRQALGPEAVLPSGDDGLELGRDALWCDITAFEEALDAGRLEEALELYRGDFLEGFFVSGAAPSFEHWVDGERARLRARAIDAVRLLEEAADRSEDVDAGIRWGRRGLVLDPLDEAAARRLMRRHAEAGDSASALRVCSVLESRFEQELGAAPSAETRSLAESIRVSAPVRGTGTPPAPERESAPAAASTGAGRLPERSLAVLPFANLSGTEEAEPFTIGLHDDLLTELSRVSALHVISRTSVLRYRGSRLGVRRIARELGVGTIVEGAVQVAGGRLRLNVQLIDARSDAHRWAERYDRELSMDGIFELQTELARKIADALRAELTPAERDRVRREPTGSMEAYRLYVQGRRSLDLRTEEGIRRAIHQFERAVAQDPSYALAWAGLTDALALLHDYGFEAADEVLPRASEAIGRAMALDPDLAEARTALGSFHGIRGDRGETIRQLRRAVELRPSYAEAHNWLSWSFLVEGSRVEALESSTRAVELDPMSPEAVSNLSMSRLVNGDATSALQEAKRVREIQPDWTTGPFYEALALHHLGRFAEAAALLRGLTVEWAGSGPQVTLALACVALGREEEASELLAGFEAADDGYAAGLVLLARGETARAFDCFRRVRRWGYWPPLSLHHFYPEVLEPLRADPLFARMLRASAGAPAPGRHLDEDPGDP